MGLYDGDLKDKIMEDIFPGSVVGDKWKTLCHMVKRAVLLFFDKSFIDDRDNWGFKRIENLGIVCESIFIKLWNSEIDNILTHLSQEQEYEPKKLHKKISFDILSNKLCSLRNWNLGTTLDLLHREAPLAIYSQLTRVASSANKKSKSLKIRMVHPSQIGYICPYETPEGESCGLVKALAVNCQVSFKDDEYLLYEVVKPYVSETGHITVLLNGMVIGRTDTDFTEDIRKIRLQIGKYISVVFRKATSEIILSCDEGRVVRMIDGEYIDALEQYYHKVLDENKEKENMLGFAASMIPFVNYNQAPRITYQCSMGRQALSAFHTYPETRLDSTIRILLNPEPPIVRTKLHDELGFDKLPAGHNVDIMIATFKGYNQEDAIIVNRNVIEKQGKFHFDIIHNYVTSSVVSRTFSETIHSIVSEGSYVKEGDILVKKTRNWVKDNRKDQDVSLYVPCSEQGIVEKVYDIEGPNERIVKIRVVDHRKLQEGDKLATRFAQKGVVGKIFDEKDLPKWKDGTAPDMIVNPHGSPSRMTVGQLMEMILGFTMKHYGYEGDFEHCGDVLEQHGHHRYLYETVYSPDFSHVIGRAQRGVCYFQVLRHLILDKIQYRGTGKLNLLTRQASHGRSIGGGLRVGDMESRGIASHAAYNFLKERYCISSDGTNFIICTKCHQFGFKRCINNELIPVCIHCADQAEFKNVLVPFSFKYLQCLLNACLVRTNLITDNSFC